MMLDDSRDFIRPKAPLKRAQSRRCAILVAVYFSAVALVAPKDSRHGWWFL